MTEKIRVSMPEATALLLKKDCADFKVAKADGTPNMNAFINTLLISFYEEFAGAEEKCTTRSAGPLRMCRNTTGRPPF